MRILVIEDSIDLADEVAEVLREMSHDVVVHGGDSLDDVLGRIVEGRFELVVVDLGLPGFEGGDLVEALAASATGPAVIVATGYGESAVAAIRPKVHGVLRKPFTVEELGDAVHRVAADRAQREGRTTSSARRIGTPGSSR